MSRERTSIFHIGSDYNLAVELVDYAGVALTAGTVSGQLYDDRDVAVGSEVSFSYDATSGKWEGVVPASDTANMVESVEYYMLITAVDDESPSHTTKYKLLKPAGYMEIEEELEE